MQGTKPPSPVEVNTVTQEDLLELYHERYGHQNKRHVKKIIQKNLTINVKADSERCEGCVYGKAHRLRFGTRKRVTKQGMLIHTDVCGLFEYSVPGYRY